MTVYNKLGFMMVFICKVCGRALTFIMWALRGFSVPCYRVPALVFSFINSTDVFAKDRLQHARLSPHIYRGFIKLLAAPPLCL